MRRISALAGGVALATAAAMALVDGPAEAAPTPTGSIIRVDSVAGGNAPPDGAMAAGVSAGGRFVLWSTTNPADQFSRLYYLTDTTTGVSQLVTKDLSGNPLTEDVSAAALSANGRYVVYVTDSPGLPHPGTPSRAGFAEVYRYDTQTGDVRVESLNAKGARPFGRAWDVGISATGRYVVYTSAARDLPGGDFRHDDQAYLFDNLTHQTVQISRNLQGGPIAGNAGHPQVSADGRYVTYETGARDVTTSTVCHCAPYVYLVDRQAPGNGTTLVSHNATRGVAGAPPAGSSVRTAARSSTACPRSAHRPIRRSGSTVTTSRRESAC